MKNFLWLVLLCLCVAGGSFPACAEATEPSAPPVKVAVADFGYMGKDTVREEALQATHLEVSKIAFESVQGMLTQDNGVVLYDFDLDDTLNQGRGGMSLSQKIKHAKEINVDYLVEGNIRSVSSEMIWKSSLFATTDKNVTTVELNLQLIDVRRGALAASVTGTGKSISKNFDSSSLQTLLLALRGQGTGGYEWKTMNAKERAITVATYDASQDAVKQLMAKIRPEKSLAKEQ